MKFILGKKLNMTQVFQEDGKVIPVTVIEAGPCQITQVKTEETDGYKSVQFGYGRKKKLLKPILGHLNNLPKFRYLKEIRLEDLAGLKRGQEFNVKMFQPGDQVKATGVSKGKGFQGVVKRHGFHGSPASHGHKDQLRMPGSIGATNAARVYKGTRMGGRMGGDQVTVANLEIIQIDPEKNLLYVKGAISGARNGLVLIKGPGEFKEFEAKEEIKSKNNIETKDSLSIESASTAAGNEEKPKE